MNTIAISIVFLVLLALAIMNGRHVKDGIGEGPLIYKSVIFKFVLNIALLSFIVFSIYLIFYNWKLLIILFLVGFVAEGLIIVPLVEKLIFKVASRK